ncbi:MAG: permease [Candidatus Wallbacteria bacterium]|nr:permease [Candidatus Wallbacteria bacterium]
MLKTMVDWLVYKKLGFNLNSVSGEAFNFFVYDTIKIFLLLTVIIFAVSFIRTFFPPERSRKILGSGNRIKGSVLAGLLGIVTPFCSCSAVPLFLGFIEAGVPMGTTFTFLVASPMINEVALVMLWGLFGWKIACLYIGSGLLIAIGSGLVIGSLHLEHLVEKFDIKGASHFELEKQSFKQKIHYARDYTGEILKTVGPYVILGIGLGALMHGYIPAGFLARYAGRDNLFAVPLVTLIGIPLYSNAAGMIPLVSVLTEKGVGMGTALAFMMAVTGLSLPEFLILKRVMKLKLLLIFASVVGTGIIITGYLFNFVIP